MTETKKPINPSFLSGPIAKFKGWSLSELNNSLIGRSHRSSDEKLKLKKLTRKKNGKLYILS